VAELGTNLSSARVLCLYLGHPVGRHDETQAFATQRPY